jgi:hypothetical protein
MSNRLTKRPCLSVEPLEDRLVPANLYFAGGNLTVANPNPLPAGMTTVNLTFTGMNQVQVMDGTSNLGTYAVSGNLSVVTGNFRDLVTVNLNGNTFTGNLNINTGNGNDTVNITGAVPPSSPIARNGARNAPNGAGNCILGWVNVQTGLGNDSVNINTTAGVPLIIGGLLNLGDTAGNDTITTGNSGAVTRIAGNTYMVGFNTVNLVNGSNDLFGGNVFILPGTDQTAVNVNEGLLGGSEVATVGGSMYIFGGQASDDVFLRGLVLGGNLVVNLAAANGPDAAFGVPGNVFAVSSSANSVTTVGGDTYYLATSGPNDVDMRSGVFDGSLIIRMGDGNDSVLLSSFAGAPTLIQGNLTVTAGNGNDQIIDNSAVIDGNVTYTLGNGNDTVDFAAGGSVAGKITYRSGNGNDSFALTGAQAYQVDVAFGNGDDTFTLNNAAATLSGRVDGGGHIAGNVFDPAAGTIAPTFILINFP